MHTDIVALVKLFTSTGHPILGLMALLIVALTGLALALIAKL